MSETTESTPNEETNGLTNVNVADNGGGMTITADREPEVDPMDVQPIEMPEQFANSDDPQQALLKSYNELRAKMSKGEHKDGQEEGTQEESTETTSDPVGEDDNTTSDTDNTDSDSTTDSTDTESLEGKYTKLYTEQGGSLTDEQLAELSQTTGETIEGIKEYIEFKKGRTEADIADSDAKVMEAIGGTEAYTEISKWANDSLPEGELSAIEGMLSNPELAVRGAQVLKQLHASRASIEPSVKVEGGNGGEAPDVYMSNAEEIEDMQNPLYKSSTKFRRKVTEKIQRSMKYHSQLNK